MFHRTTRVLLINISQKDAKREPVISTKVAECYTSREVFWIYCVKFLEGNSDTRPTFPSLTAKTLARSRPPPPPSQVRYTCCRRRFSKSFNNTGERERERDALNNKQIQRARKFDAASLIYKWPLVSRNYIISLNNSLQSTKTLVAIPNPFQLKRNNSNSRWMNPVTHPSSRRRVFI